MAKQFYLTEKDRGALVDLIKEVMHQYGNPRIGSQDEPVGYSSDVHIVKVPHPDGIPKREGLTPGKAECEVYRLKAPNEVIPIGDREYELTPVMRPDGSTPLKIWVLNIYRSDIPASDDPEDFNLIKVTRDKFGSWIADRIGLGTTNAKALVRYEGEGPIRWNETDPDVLEGLMGDVEILEEPEWEAIGEGDDCIVEPPTP